MPWILIYWVQPNSISNPWIVPDESRSCWSWLLFCPSLLSPISAPLCIVSALGKLILCLFVLWFNFCFRRHHLSGKAPGGSCRSGLQSPLRMSTASMHSWVILIFISLSVFFFSRYCFRVDIPDGNGQPSSDSLNRGFCGDQDATPVPNSAKLTTPVKTTDSGFSL